MGAGRGAFFSCAFVRPFFDESEDAEEKMWSMSEKMIGEKSAF